MRRLALVLWLLVTNAGVASELPILSGPAMGTTYRVMLAADVPGMARGEVHREVEAVLARIDRAASTWRDDSDASLFNRAATGDWVTVSVDLASIVETARVVHMQSDGAFDITVGPLVRLWAAGGDEPTAAAIAAARGRVGMRWVEYRPATAEAGPALRKSIAGVEIDLSGIAPGYAVDRIGERLVALGSKAHLVELGGEVRAWGRASASRPWRVRLRGADVEDGTPHSIDLADGTAVATSTCRLGRSPIDPRTGQPVAATTLSTASSARRTATMRAASCATADAWAVAAIVLSLEPDDDGTVTAPSRTAGPIGARRAGP